MFKAERRRTAKYGIKTVQTPISDYNPNNLKVDLKAVENLTHVTQRCKFSLAESQKMLRPGVLGCFYSHYRLWQKCVELNEPIFIFEDDVIFERGYEPVEWEDVLMVCTGKETYKHRHYAPMLFEPTGDPQAIELRNTSMPGAVGYGLTPTGAAKLVKAYKKETLPADTAMNVFVVKLQCHNYLMGRAALEEDGKISMTSTNIWGKGK
jgi:GR25 family glycosyltransferase involved in LPS biosynthesis